MTAAPLPKGWCPTLLSPMASGDGLLVRVKPTGSVLTATSARALAEAADSYGNGLIDLTGRANLQFRGLKPETVAPFAETILDLGLAHPDPEVERIRNIVTSPLAAWDPSAACDAQALARALEAMLASEPRLKSLPDKFGFLIDVGGLLPLDDQLVDIEIKARCGFLRVGIDGLFCEAGTEAEAVDAARYLALAFLDLAARCPAPPRRMRDLVNAVGADTIFATAGLTPTPLPSPCPSPRKRGEGTPIDAVQTRYPRPATTGGERAVRSEAEDRVRGEGRISENPMKATETSWSARIPPIGWLPYPDPGTGAFGLGMPFGQMTAPMFLALADIAERYGDGILRLTPWRAVLLPNLAERDASSLRIAAEASGLIADPADSRLSISACPGKPACASATVETRADTEILARSGIARNLHIHVSGCAKGCAHRGPAAVTLVGENGTYALVRHGRAWDEPALRNLTIAQAIAALRAHPEGRP